MRLFHRCRPAAPLNPTPPTTSDERLALILEQAARALGQQISAIDALRTRAGTIVAAASLASSFLGAIVLREEKLSTSAAISSAFALFSLLVVVGATIKVLWPQEWRTGFDAQKAIQDYIDTPPMFSLDEVRRDLALQLQIDNSHNEKRLKRLYQIFQLSIGALAAEVCLWLLALALR